MSRVSPLVLLRRLLIAAVVVAVVARCAHAPEPGQLTPVGGRITDEAIASDLALMRDWARRLDRADSSGATTPARAYGAARARALLAFALDEYQDNDRGGIVDDAFGRATAEIARLELGVVTDEEMTLPRGARQVRPELWTAARRYKASPRFDLVAADVGRLEVALVRAGHSGAPGAACSAAPHEAEADSLARHIEAVLRDAPPPAPVVAPPAPAVTPPAPPPAVPVPVIPAPVDSDHDGVPDQFDCCPNSTPGAAVDATGCERLPAENVPMIIDGLRFDTDRSVIRPESRLVLDRIATLLLARPDILIEIAGHTDSIGDAAYNRALSSARAAAVRRYFVARGVAGARISSVGEGEARPIADNGSAAGRARNRRVELVWRRPERSAPRVEACTVPAGPPGAPTPADTVGPVMITSVYFAFASSQLGTEARALLEHAADVLRAEPAGTVLIAGHTDSIGPAAFNEILSLNRARMVRDFLLQRGVAADRLRTTGFGEDAPVASNATAAGRALNRRAEVYGRTFEDARLAQPPPRPPPP